MLSAEADEDLMVRYQRGEVRAFEILLGRHRKSVFNFILRYVGDKETAEDLLQETFMRVIKGAEAYKRQAKFTTWLYTIARNLCVDQTRRRKHRRHASLDAPMASDADSGTLLDVIPGSEMASDRKTVNKQLYTRLQGAIAALGDEQREAIRTQVPLQRYGTADEVAQTVLWLTGPGAAYVTGAVIPVDGGLGMGH
jgi:RNA polymerase sigma-70 factor (ECF subfamily)